MGSLIAKWYVYKLVDPRNGKPFYIGKGTGNRVSQHVKNYSKAKQSNAGKNSKIESIIKSGYIVLEQKIAYFFKEQDAYDFEASLIKSLPNLTNIEKSGKARVKYSSLLNTVRIAITGEKGYKEAERQLGLFKCYQMPSKDHLALYLCALKHLKFQRLRGKEYAS